jgi:lysophospholipase L1-like esterase
MSRVCASLSLLCLFLTTLSAALSFAKDAPPRPYLALGDSVTFGFINEAGYEYVSPQNFVGYPDYVGRALHLSDTDAACPGETSSSFLSATAADGGCREFRSLAHLHVSYKGTQATYGLAFLARHPDTRLVTVMLGANDIFLLEGRCKNDPTCIQQGLPAVLRTVATKTATILGEIRAAGYKGVLVIVNYYSLDYSNTFETEVTAALNEAVATPAQATGAVVADVFTAFQRASARVGGVTCQAGLLNAQASNQFACDVHPSQSGQKLIARTVDATFGAAVSGGAR